MSDDRRGRGPVARALGLARRREVAFLLVGGTNMLVGLGAFQLFNFLWGAQIHYLGALVAAYAVGIALGFYLYRRFVFRVKGHVLRDLLRFTSVQCISLAINSVALPLIVEVAHVPVPPAQVLALVVVVLISYFGHLLFSFRR